ncbi:hypothetical protein [Halolamina salifodinae]|uniref:Uncharacterized protein n=1 Tax=Halolamina salifodinae TaxID=1202767 RepID=A0A8T4GSW5_9EURY|nr:hypothetical protein [Halolamina salifodinae]MBP1985969.1 hypothetical protein [Halolamina salifodinae]
MATTQTTQRQQLAKMPKALLKGVSLTLQVLWVPVIAYSVITSIPAISTVIEAYLNTAEWELYALCAIGGMLLLNFSAILENDLEDDSSEESADEEEEDSSGNDLIEGARMIYEGLGAITYFSLYVIFAVFAGLIVATYVSPVFGPAVAVLYPSAEYTLSNQLEHQVTPSALTMYPALIPVIIGTGLIVLAAFVLGSIIGVPTAIVKGLAEQAPPMRTRLPFSRNGHGRRPMK